LPIWRMYLQNLKIRRNESVRKWVCVPMITLCLLTAACGSGEETADVDMRQPYLEMSGCTMTAVVTCEQAGAEWSAELKCDYVPGEESTVEVLSPETIAGVKAVFTDTDWRLEYGGKNLSAGTLSSEQISPAVCLPRLVSALRDGWLLEENQETWGDTPCLRLTVDQTGADEKIISTVWLRQNDGLPLRGEISVAGENILTAEFTSFQFYDMIAENTQEEAGT